MSYATWKQWRMCDRKRALSKIEANLAVLSAWKRGDWQMASYRCEHCGCWHVGHQRKESV